jgi:hypothetical protein
MEILQLSAALKFYFSLFGADNEYNFFYEVS